MTVNPSAGYTVGLTALNFEVASFGGATTLTLTNSSNNVLGTVVAPAAANTGNNGYPGFNEPVSLSLTGAAMLNASTTFRLYVYGSGDDGNDDGAPYSIGFNSVSADASEDSFVIDGTAAPELSTEAFIAAGALLPGFGILRRGKRAAL